MYAAANLQRRWFIGEGLIKNMDYVVFDLEWNQSNTRSEPKVENFPFEIIEIGAVRLTEDGVLDGEFNELIKPQVYKEMHRITGKLVHLTMQELKHSRSFPEVATRFEIWCGEGAFLYCTWGTLDLMELQRNRMFFHMTPLAEEPIAYIDVQKLFALTYDTENPRKRRALQDAVDYLRIEKHIPFHRAFSDAYYTAKVMQVILRKNPGILEHVSYDVFYPPTSRETEVKHQFDTYFKYISKVFPGKKELMLDREVSSSKCYLCHKNLKKRVRWFTANNKHYLCLAYCDKHGYLKGKIRVNRSRDGGVFAVKTTKLVSDEVAQSIIDRWEHMQGIKRRAEENSRARKNAQAAEEIVQTDINVQAAEEIIQTDINAQAAEEIVQTDKNMQAAEEIVQTDKNMQAAEEIIQTDINAQATEEIVQNDKNVQAAEENAKDRKNAQPAEEKAKGRKNAYSAKTKAKAGKNTQADTEKTEAAEQSDKKE